MQPEQVTTADTVSSNGDPQSPSGQRQAQKRVAIGLSPRRPTARAVVQRPPRTGLARWQQWAIAGLVGALMLATVLLVVAKASGAATAWPQVQSQLTSWLTGQPLPNAPDLSAPIPGYRLRLEETFARTTRLVAANQQTGQWTTEILPDQGIYRFQLWPGRLFWSTLAVEDLATYWLEASFTIADVMPEGYTGFLGRYQDTENFYLFAINGAANYQVLLWQGGQLTTLQAWTPGTAINPAGSENVLAIEDDGQGLRFYANEQRLFTVPTPVLPIGATGLVGGAGEQKMAEISVDWLRLYTRPQ